MSETQVNYTKEVFLHPWNLAFLIAAMAGAFILSASGLQGMQQIILFFTAAAELLLLGMVPRNKRFRRAVDAKAAAEHNKPLTQKEIFRNLSKTNQKRYLRLRKIEEEIKQNYKKLSYASQGMLESHIKKIDGLLTSYLNLLTLKERYGRFSRSSTGEEVARAIEALQTDMADDPPKVRAIKARRMTVLEKRLEKFKKSQENLEVIEAQLETIEDVSKYIHEQSLTMRNPEEVSFQLDTLLSEVEETQSSIQELEDVFARPTDLLSEIDTYTSEDPLNQQTGTRIQE